MNKIGVVKKEIDSDLLRMIDELQLNKRLIQWKEAMFNAKPEICSDRAKHAMQSWKETEGEDIEIRWSCKRYSIANSYLSIYL